MYSTTNAYQPGPKLDATRSLLIGMKEKGTLQSYVAQHRNSPEYPYLLALASSISQISDATKAAEHQPPQQTVADQQLGALAPAPQTALPENVGIGQLPAPNLETVGKAAGGIIAFGDGGEVPRFNEKGLVYSPYSYGNMGAQTQLTPAQFAEAKRLREMGMFDLLKEKFGPAWQALTTGPGPQVGSQQTYQSGTDLEGRGSSPANMGAPVVGKTLDFKNPETDGGAKERAGVTPPPNPNAGLPSLGGYEKRLGDIVYKNAPKKEDYMKEAAEIDKPVIEKAQEVIDTQKSKLKTEGEQNFFMSMIIGGLEAAGGDSQYALQNIAKGGTKGAANFNEGIKDLRKAAQENSKMEMELAKYKATGEKDALKSYYSAQERRDDRYADGMTRIMTQQMQTQGQIAAAGAGARAGVDAQISMLERLGSAKEGSPLLTGLERKTQEDKIPRLYAEYTKLASDPMKGEDFLRKYPTFDVYRSGMGGASSNQFVNLPNGTVPSAVRSRPN